MILPDIYAAVVSAALVGVVGADGICLAFVVELHLCCRDALAFSIGCNVVYAAFREVIVVSIAAFSIGVADEFERIVRVCFSNLDEVVHLSAFGRKRLVFVEAEVNAFNVVVVLLDRRFNDRCRSRFRRVNRFRSRSFFVAAAEAIGEASDEAFVGDVSVVFQCTEGVVAFISQFGVQVTIASADVEVRCDAVAEASFPHGRLLGTDSAFSVEVEVLSQRSFGDQADLSDVVGVVSVTAEVVLNAVPASEGSEVLVDGVNEVYFVFITIGLVRLVVVALGLQAVVVVLQSPFVGKAVAETALEVPFGARIFLSTVPNFFGPVAGINRSFRVPSA